VEGLLSTPEDKKGERRRDDLYWNGESYSSNFLLDD